MAMIPTRPAKLQSGQASQACRVGTRRQKRSYTRQPAFKLQDSLRGGVDETRQEQELAVRGSQSRIAGSGRDDALFGEPRQKHRIVVAAGVAEMHWAHLDDGLKCVAIIVDF